MSLKTNISACHGKNEASQAREKTWLTIEAERQKQPVSRLKPDSKAKLHSYIQRLEQQHYQMLCQKYKDEIEFIRKRYPAWTPVKKLFDIQG